MTRRMYRYEVPVDDKPHPFKLGGHPGRVEAVGSGATHVVEFWAQHHDGYGLTRHFQVFGTGHPVPGDATWRGTTGRTADGLVWHLFEVYP